MGRKRSQFWRYGVAVLAVAIALIVKLFLAALIQQESPFMLFFVAILVSAWYGGMTAGLAATLLAALLCDYFFLTPKYELVIADWGQGVRLAIFVLEAICICAAVTILNSARERAQQSQLAALHCQATLLQTWSSQQEILFDLAPGTFAGTYEAALDRIHPADRASVENAIAHALEVTGQFEQEFRILATDGSVRWLAGQGKVFYDDAKRAIRMIGINRNISEQRQAAARINAALQEKETLLKEIHYSVKNNLQVIVSLLNFRSNYVGDLHAVEVLKAGENWLFSMASAHELLSQSQNLARINLAEYIERLATHLYRTANPDLDRVTLAFNLEPIWLSIDLAIPCGLIVNELVSNRLKYAFPPGRIGQIEITIQSADRENFILKVGDDGTSLPVNFDCKATESLVLQIVNTLANQLQGKIELTKKEIGTEFVVRFAAQTSI